MARLVYVDRNGRERTVTMGPDFPKVTVGRNPDCVIHTTKPSVSRLHTEFVYNRGVFEVTDLGSSNGTFINGREIRRQALNDRDEVRCGEFTIRFFTDDEQGNESLGPQPLEDPDRLDSYRNQPTSRQAALDRPAGGQEVDDSGYPGEQRPYGSGGSFQRAAPSHPSTASGGFAPNQMGNLDQVRKENRELREKIADQQAVIDVMRDDAEPGKELDRLRQDIKRAASANDVLRQERDDVLAAADRQREQASDNERDTAQQKLLVESLQDKNRSLSAEVEECRAEADTARADSVRANNELEASQSRIEELEGLERQHRATIDSLTDQTTEQRAQLNRVEKNNHDSQQSVQESEQELVRLRGEVESLRALLDDGSGQVENLNDELSSLRAVLEGKEAELIEADQKAVKLQQELADGGQVAPDDDAGDDLMVELEARQKSIEDLERKNDALRVALDEAFGDDAPDQARLNSLLAQREATIATLEEKNVSLEGVASQLEALRQEHLAVIEDSRSLKEKLEVARQAETSDEDRTGLEAEIDELRAANRRHNEEMDRMMQDLASPSGDNEEVSALHEELEALAQENARLQKDLDLVATESDRLVRQVEELSAVRPQVTEPSGSDMHASHQVSDLQEDLQAAFSELEQAKEQLLASQQWLTQTTANISRTAEQLSATSQQLSVITEEEANEDSTLKARISGSYDALDDEVTSLSQNLSRIGSYVGEIHRLYVAVQRADLQTLQTLDRVRIEKVMRDVDPDTTFEALEKAVSACSLDAQSMREQLRDYRENME